MNNISKTLKCLANWINLERNDEILLEFPKLALNNLIFQSFNSPELMDKGVRCFCNFIKRVSQSDNYYLLFNYIFEKVMILFPQ